MAQLQDQSARHTAHLERLKSGYVKEFEPFLLEMKKVIGSQLGGELITDWSRNRLEKQLQTINKLLLAPMQDYEKVLLSQIKELSEYEAGFEVRSLQNVVADFNYTIPSATQLSTAVMSTPLGIKGADGGKLLDAYIKDWTKKEATQVSNVLRIGAAQGQTTTEVIRNMRAAVDVSARSAEMIARTALQHTANQAREATYAANSDLIEKVKWVSILDGNTSPICRSLSSSDPFPVNEGPRPPAHPNACLPGTMIETRRGQIEIERVKVGDYVKTHTGRYKQVYIVMAREHNGKALTLKDNFGASVSLTNEHPVLTRDKGWVEAGNVESGDVLFYDIEQLDGLDSIRESSLVPQRVLINSHNIETSVTDELVSYGIFSGAAGMTSAIHLNSCVSHDKVGVVSKNPFVHFVVCADIIKNRCKKSFVFSRVFGKCYSERISRFNNSIPIKRWVRNLHSFGRFSAASSVSVWSYFTPMGLTRRNIAKLHIINNRLVSTLSSYSMSNTSFSKCVIAETVLPFDAPKTFPKSVVFIDNKAVKCGEVHNDSSWLASTCTESVAHNYSGYVYNLAVKDDETYLADGFVVHNCRSTTVPILRAPYDKLSKGAQQRARPPTLEDGELKRGKIESVSAKTTYYSWLKNQPASVQNSIVGPTRGKLLRNGGISAERFAELQLGRNFKPITLAEMREIEPVAFSRANIPEPK